MTAVSEQRETGSSGGGGIGLAANSRDIVVALQFDPREGVAELEAHLAWLRDEAGARGFAIDRHAIRNELQAATFALREPRVVRLALSSSGALAIETRSLRAGALPDQPIRR